MRMNKGSIQVFRPTVAIEYFDDEALFFLTDQMITIHANEVTAQISRLISKETSTKEIIKYIVHHRQFTPSVAEEYVSTVINELISRDVVFSRIRMNLTNDKEWTHRLFCANDQIITSETEPDLLGDRENCKTYRLNSTGSEVWRLLKYPRSAEEIVSFLYRVYPEEALETIVYDVVEVLSVFLKNRLIVEVKLADVL